MLADRLEYLMCSLPDLAFQQSFELKQNITTIFRQYDRHPDGQKKLMEILHDEATNFLSPNELQIFKKIQLNHIHEKAFQDSKSVLLNEFSKFNFELKKKLEQLRLLRKGNKENTSSDKESIITPGNPLEQELQIMQLQWDKIEEISVGHFTDFNALIAYKLKLTILIRWWSFDAVKGFENFTIKTKNN